MRKLLLGVVLLCAATAAADLAGRWVKYAQKVDTGVALSADAPSGSSNGTGGYSLQATNLTTGAASYTVSEVWCELETEGTDLTGGSLRWWRQTESDGGWATTAALDESIGALNEKRWASAPIRVLGPTTRVYCQPLSVTESGDDADGGLVREYHFRMVAP